MVSTGLLGAGAEASNWIFGSSWQSLKSKRGEIDPVISLPKRPSAGPARTREKPALKSRPDSSASV